MAKPSEKLHELNYVKALAIIMMVVIHMIEEFSVFNEMHDTPDTLFQKVIIALSLAPCTHAFLLSIGMGISLSGKKSPGLMAKRGLRLLLLGFELNIARAVLPLLLCGLAGGPVDTMEILRQAVAMDILQFAAFCYLLTALLRKFRIPDIAWLPIGILMYFLSVFLNDQIQTDSFPEQILLSPFIYSHNSVYFTLLNLFVYVAAGNLIGNLIRRTNDRDRLYRWLLPGSIAGLALLLVICTLAGRDIRTFFAYNLYQEDLEFFVFSVLVFVLELSLFHSLHRLCEGSVIARIAEFCGKRLNTIYLIHWVILSWFTLLFAPLLNIPVFSFEGAVLAGVILAVVSAWITSLLPSSLNLSR